LKKCSPFHNLNELKHVISAEETVEFVDRPDVNIIEYQQPVGSDVRIQVIIFQLWKGKCVRAVDKDNLKGPVERLSWESPLRRSLNELCRFFSKQY
jgi:hypothetical protein